MNHYYDYHAMNLEDLNIDKAKYNKIIKEFPIIKNLEDFMNRYNQYLYDEYNEYTDEGENIFKGIYELFKEVVWES